MPEKHDVENEAEEQQEELDSAPPRASGGPAPEDTAPDKKLPVPSALLAFVGASLVSFLIILLGFIEADSLGCEGGLCAFTYFAAFRNAIIAWIVVFPVAWLLIAAVRRS